MRQLLLAPIFLFFTGCASVTCTGYMDASSSAGERRRYSPYYELEREFKDKGLLTRLVITLGEERIPSGYVSKNDILSHCSGGIVPWVSEVYFINTSQRPIAVEPTKLLVGGSSKSFQGPVTIAPGKWFITAPLIEASSNYGVEAQASFEFIVMGEAQKVDGTAKRMTMEEVGAKYRAK